MKTTQTELIPIEDATAWDLAEILANIASNHPEAALYTKAYRDEALCAAAKMLIRVEDAVETLNYAIGPLTQPEVESEWDYLPNSDEINAYSGSIDLRSMSDTVYQESSENIPTPKVEKNDSNEDERPPSTEIMEEIKTP